MILDMCGAMPDEIASIIGKIVNIIKIVVPIGLVIFGMLDFGKSVFAHKEEEISTNRKLFFQRLISGALVFFVIAIVQLVFGMIDANGSSEAISCLNAILGGNVSNSGSGGSGNGKKTTTKWTPSENCNDRAVGDCNTDGKCHWCGNISFCVKEGEPCPTTTTTANNMEKYQKWCSDLKEEIKGSSYKIHDACIACASLYETNWYRFKNCALSKSLADYKNNLSEAVDKKIDECKNKYQSLIEEVNARPTNEMSQDDKNKLIEIHQTNWDKCIEDARNYAGIIVTDISGH